MSGPGSAPAAHPATRGAGRGARTAFKRPESVLVVVYTLSGLVLLLERNAPRDFWQSVTGSLNWGESAPAAARRELAEETGLCGVPVVDCQRVASFPILPQWRRRYAPGVRNNREYVFRAVLPAPAEVRLRAAEHRRSLWLPREAALRQAWSWTNRAAIRAFVPRHEPA